MTVWSDPSKREIGLEKDETKGEIQFPRAQGTIQTLGHPERSRGLALPYRWVGPIPRLRTGWRVAVMV